MSETVTANKTEAIPTCAYDRYCEQIDKEDGLIDRRVNWLLTSQSILFAALGLSGKQPKMAPIVAFVVPWVGLFSSLAIGVTVCAASASFRRYRNGLMSVCHPEDDKDRHYPQLHRSKCIIRCGLLPSSIVPFVFSAAWIAVMILVYGTPVN